MVRQKEDQRVTKGKSNVDCITEAMCSIAFVRTWSHWSKLWLSTFTYSSKPVDQGGLQRTESMARLQPSIVDMDQGVDRLRASPDL